MKSMISTGFRASKAGDILLEEMALVPSFKGQLPSKGRVVKDRENGTE